MYFKYLFQMRAVEIQQGIVSNTIQYNLRFVGSSGVYPPVAQPHRQSQSVMPSTFSFPSPLLPFTRISVPSLFNGEYNPRQNLANLNVLTCIIMIMHVRLC